MSEDPTSNAASETTPLLANGKKTSDVESISPTAASARDQDVTQDDASKPTSTDGDGLERQQGHEGMPEMRSRLPYIVVALGIGIFLVSADQTLIVACYERIGSELGALNLTSWTATAFLMCLTCSQPIYAKISDIYGRKPCILTAYTIFGLASIGCGLAQDMKQFIAARAVAGLGGGGMMSVVSILLSDLVPLRERGTWQGYLNVPFVLGAAIGAPLGGFMADSVGWRWAFLAQGPIAALAFVTVFLALRVPPRPGEDADWKKKLRRVDFAGSVLLIGAIFTLLLALDRGGNVGWDTPVVLISAAVCVVTLVAFLVVEWRYAVEPCAPKHIICDKRLIPLYLCNFFAMSGWLALQLYVSLYWQAGEGVSASTAGLRFIPAFICGSAGSFLAGWLLQRTGKFRTTTICCYTGLTLGMLLVVLCTGVVTKSVPGTMVGMSINALSNGIGITTTLIGIIATAPVSDTATATGASYLFRSLGSVFGVSLSATQANVALRRALAAELPALGLPAESASRIAAEVRASLSFLHRLPPEVRMVVADCYARSAANTFVLQTVMVAGAMVCAWLVRDHVLK